MKILFVGFATLDFFHNDIHPGGAAGGMSLNAAQLEIEAFLFAPLSHTGYGAQYEPFLSSVNTSLCDWQSPNIPNCVISNPHGGLGNGRVWNDNGALEHFATMPIMQAQLQAERFDAVFFCNAPPSVTSKIAPLLTTEKLFWIPGPKVVADPTAVPREVLQKTTLLFANEEEFPIVIAKEPLKLGVQHVIHTKGKDGGSVLSASGEQLDFTAPQIENLVDATGAGDCFSLGFATDWLQNQSLDSAIFNGQKLAAQCVQKWGVILPAQHTQ